MKSKFLKKTTSKDKSFKWGNFLTLAEQLSSMSKNEDDNGIKEAELRSSMSRGYYAVHNKARDFLISIDEVEKKDRISHRELIDIFLDGDENFADLGDLLDHMKTIRELADYDDIIYGDISKKNKYFLDIAKEALGILKKISSS